jgi:hypothetical protein
MVQKNTQLVVLLNNKVMVQKNTQLVVLLNNKVMVQKNTQLVVLGQKEYTIGRRSLLTPYLLGAGVVTGVVTGV